jgi:hypothetical protein
MPYVKIKIEVEYYANSKEEIVKAIESGVEDIYNISHEWVINQVPPDIESEVDDDINVLFKYNNNKWEA